MPKTLTHRKACRFCNSRSIKHALRFVFTPPDTAFVTVDDGSAESPEAFPLIISLCEKCKLVQMLDVVDPITLYKHYPHANFVTPSVTHHFDAYAQEAVNKGHIQKGDLIVDIGSGDGDLLRAFKKLGMKVIGVDPSTHSANQAKIDGIIIYSDYFTPQLAGQILKEHGKAALITANFVLGSVDNLHAFMAGVRHILRPDGLFYFEEPYLADILEKNLFDVFHHERLSLVTATPLEPFLRSTHMHLMDVRRSPFRSGSIRCIAQRSDGPHVVSASLKSFIDGEQSSNIHSAETLASFAARIEDLKTSLKKMVADLKSEGKRVAGYGASGRTVTFVHECGWQSDVLEYIIDDNPFKHDLMLPGTSIKVVHPNAIRDQKPDVIVLFAHNYADHILHQHEEFRKAGGKFIIPFPMPKFA